MPWKKQNLIHRNFNPHKFSREITQKHVTFRYYCFLENAQFFEILQFIYNFLRFLKKNFLTVKSRSVSHEPKQFLKMVSRKK